MATMILDVYVRFGGLMHQLTTGGPHIVPPGIPGDYSHLSRLLFLDNPSGVGTVNVPNWGTSFKHHPEMLGSSDSLPGDGRMGHLTTVQLGLICFLKPLPMTTFC